jgi:hypothetical protein
MAWKNADSLGFRVRYLLTRWAIRALRRSVLEPVANPSLLVKLASSEPYGRNASRKLTPLRYTIKMLVQLLKLDKPQIHPRFNMYWVINKCFRWPNSLMRRSAATWLLGSRIRIPPRACISVVCVVCLCCELVTRS